MKRIAVLIVTLFFGIWQSNADDSTCSNVLDRVCSECSAWCRDDSLENNEKEKVSKIAPDQMDLPEGPHSCREFNREAAKSKNKTGGVFDIVIPGIGIKEVYCDVYTDPEDWIVFQRRMDGSVDFNRKWNDYVNGFGNASGEFWLGLEALHQITRIGTHAMRIEMVTLDGTAYFAKYRTFYIGPASEGYRISICGHSGNTTDAFGFMHNNMRFSTHERDQDLWDGGNCAKDYGGGWWFNNCLWSNLNGVYGEQYDGGVTWFHQQFPVKDLRMKYVEMKFRKSNIW